MSGERHERVSLLAVHNKTIILEQSLARAHERVDDVKTTTAKDLSAIQAIQVGISNDIKLLLEFKNRALGWAAAALCFAGLLGGCGSVVASAIVRALTAQPAVEHTVGPLRK
jgi:hypothetical protein